jgi:hypothetical protein
VHFDVFHPGRHVAVRVRGTGGLAARHDSCLPITGQKGFVTARTEIFERKIEDVGAMA